MKRLVNLIINNLQSKKDNIKFGSEILTSFATIISAIVVVLTLQEMQVQRNNAYMPDIIFETVSFNISWGDPEKLNDLGLNFDETKVTNSDSSYIVPVRNIGVGAAKKLSFTINDKNLIAWISFFNELNPENQYTYTQNGKMFSMANQSLQIGFPSNYHVEKTFLLPNAEEIYDFIIPMQYTLLLEEFFSTLNTEPIDIPNLEVQVSFEDVQGVKYSKTILLDIETTSSIQDSNGNGMAICQVSMI